MKLAATSLDSGKCPCTASGGGTIQRTILSAIMQPQNMNFRSEFLILQQEGYLFRSCLTQGLTALRNANLNKKEHYYAAFFQLSIGLERLMKVIFVIDHVARNARSLPSTAVLRKLGHDLHQLIAAVHGIEAPWPTHPLAFLEPSTIEWDIVDHLNAFAKSTRYFNLDSLTAGTPAIDPLKGWNTITQRIIATDISEHERTRLTAGSQQSAEFVGNCGLLVAHDLEQQAISWQRWFADGSLYEVAAGHATYRVMRILAGLKEVLYEVTSAAHAEYHRLGLGDPLVPFMYEFLDFVHADCRRVRKKKRWP